MLPNLSVAIPETLASELENFLIRDDEQENLLFALYTLSKGVSRQTALIHTLIFPEENDHQIHGNVSFNPQYLERVYGLVMQQEQCGIVFLHSHPPPSTGWQSMSKDDIAAEQYISRGAWTCTELPLFGMTISSDGVWSARVWDHAGDGEFIRKWCSQVRVVGKQLRLSYPEHLSPVPTLDPIFQNSQTVFGKVFPSVQRLHVGIVGLGSVGSHVAETLARIGISRFTLLDFDEVQKHNLDRLVGATRDSLGHLKTTIAEKHIRNSAIVDKDEVLVFGIPSSVVEKDGYTAMLDCDVIFCCVDRPHARKILNHIAFAHLIPVIDGGIAVRFKANDFAGVDWQLQTATIGNPCLKCCGVYDDMEADLDRQGFLDNPSYMRNSGIKVKRNENVFPFTANLSSLEVIQFIALVTGTQDFGIQRYRFHPGTLESHLESEKPYCHCMDALIAQGDRYFTLTTHDYTAEQARTRQANTLN